MALFAMLALQACIFNSFRFSIGMHRRFAIDSWISLWLSFRSQRGAHSGYTTMACYIFGPENACGPIYFSILPSNTGGSADRLFDKVLLPGASSARSRCSMQQTWSDLFGHRQLLLGSSSCGSHPWNEKSNRFAAASAIQ